jgi:hypothetical protein
MCAGAHAAEATDHADRIEMSQIQAKYVAHV